MGLIIQLGGLLLICNASQEMEALLTTTKLIAFWMQVIDLVVNEGLGSYYRLRSLAP